MKKYRSAGSVFGLLYVLCMMSWPIFLLVMRINEKVPGEYWISIIFLIIISLVVIFVLGSLIHQFTLPALPRETKTERQAFEAWMASLGYRKFFGKYKDKGETVIFKLDKQVAPFAKTKTETDHDNYRYQDYGPYRIIYRADYSTDPEVYVK